jgi:hypothetical protein
MSYTLKIIKTLLFVLSITLTVPNNGTSQDTQSASCYDTKGNELIPCPAIDKESSSKAPFVRNNGDGTVTDFKTSLMWLQKTADKDKDGLISGTDTFNWQDAGIYCDNLEFAGYSDWRLPETGELSSLVLYNTAYPATSPVFSTQSSYYWTSTEYATNQKQAWSVSFYFGNSAWNYKSSQYYVRCVRNEVPVTKSNTP